MIHYENGNTMLEKGSRLVTAEGMSGGSSDAMLLQVHQAMPMAQHLEADQQVKDQAPLFKR